MVRSIIINLKGPHAATGDSHRKNFYSASGQPDVFDSINLGPRQRGMSMPAARRILGGCLLAVLLLASASPSSAIILRRSKATPIGASVVQISVFDWRGVFLRQGWGFFINEDAHVITCRSLLEGSFFVEVTSGSRETFTVTRVLSEDLEGNLIRVGLEFRPERFAYLRSAGKIPDEGARVLVGGGQGCEPGAFLDGTVQSVRKVPIFGHMMKVVSPFASVGSPVFSEKGELVGVIMFTETNGGSTAWAVSVGRISRLMSMESTPIDHLQWAERQAGSWRETPVGAYMTGLAHYWGGQHTRAMPYLEKATADERFSKEAYFLLGCCNDANEHYQESVKAYSMAVLLDPNSQEALIRLARALVEKGDHAAALDAAWQAVRLQSNSYEPYLIISCVCNHLGQFEQALSASFVALKLNPSCPQAYREQGLAFRELGKYEESVNAFRNAMKLDPGYAQSYWDLALAYMRIGDREEAAKICGALKKVNLDLSEKLAATLSTR